MKILFLCSNGQTEASMRFRVEAFLPWLERAGHQPHVSTFFSEAGDGGWGRRVIAGFGGRLLDLLRARTVDRIFIHREILPLALNQLVYALPSDTPLLFDFDDAVFLQRTGGLRNRLACPASTRLLVERANLVYAGNEYLADYARQFSTRVKILPTVVDTDRFAPGNRPASTTLPVVGWVGSPSTSPYLDAILPALDRVAREVPFHLRLVGAGRKLRLDHAEVENVPWRLSEEVAAFQALDVGIYPLADDDWSRGKCGFKAIQFMACGVPFIASPVGVVRDIVRPGQDGLLAHTQEEWIENLVDLLRSPSLRQKLGSSGRHRAVEHYSVASIGPDWIRGVVNPGDISC